MDNVYTFYSKDIEELVKNLKSTFFDVVATNQQNINNLEETQNININRNQNDIDKNLTEEKFQQNIPQKNNKLNKLHLSI